MKTLMLIVVTFLAVNSVSIAQKVKPENVPSSVMTAFKSKFPDVSKVKWSLEKANEYEAEFKQDGKGKSANFSGDGTWLETETEISKSLLPKVVVDAITKQYSNYKIEETELSETPANSSFYSVTIEVNEKKFDVEIKPNGELIKAEQVIEEDED